MSHFVSGVVLAAGTSSRMGRPKLLLPLAGRPVLQHVLDAAAGSCLDEIIVVLGHHALEIAAAIRLPSAPAMRVVVNRDYVQGLGTSLRLGLRGACARAQAAAILLGDQPFVTGRLIDRLAAAVATTAAPVVRPVYSDHRGHRVPGHPVFLARRIWSQLQHLGGDQGARVLLAAHPDWLLEVPVGGGRPDDIDTWDDYQRALGVARAAALEAAGPGRGQG
ncbi:MAG: NTP transferase domain-containing protein [Candidatus Binatia bacterium]